MTNVTRVRDIRDQQGRIVGALIKVPGAALGISTNDPLLKTIASVPVMRWRAYNMIDGLVHQDAMEPVDPTDETILKI